MQQLRHILIPVLILAAGVGGYYGLTVWKQPPPRTEVPYLPPLVETATASAFQDSFPLKVHGEETLRVINGHHPRGEPRAGDYIKLIE